MSRRDPAATSDHAAAGRVRVRVQVPTQLRELAGAADDVVVDVTGPVTVGAVVDALEHAHPALAGTIRHRTTGERRPLIRVYADGQDYSYSWHTELPTAVRAGREPLRLIGAIAGG